MTGIITDSVISIVETRIGNYCSLPSFRFIHIIYYYYYFQQEIRDMLRQKPSHPRLYYGIEYYVGNLTLPPTDDGWFHSTNKNRLGWPLRTHQAGPGHAQFPLHSAYIRWRLFYGRQTGEHQITLIRPSQNGILDTTIGHHQAKQNLDEHGSHLLVPGREWVQW